MIYTCALLYFCYEATASLAKPINRGIHDVWFVEFSYGKLRFSYGDLCRFNDGMDFISKFFKELLSAFWEHKEYTNKSRIIKLVLKFCRIPLNSRQRYCKIFVHAIRFRLDC